MNNNVMAYIHLAKEKKYYKGKKVMPKHGNTHTHTHARKRTNTHLHRNAHTYARTYTHTTTQTLVQRERKINDINMNTEM